MKTPYILLLFFALFYAAAGNKKTDCAYTLYVRTSGWLTAGTKAKIQAELIDRNGSFVSISNLKSIGIMEDGHKYLQRANIDIFATPGRCLGNPVCRLRLTTDGKGFFIFPSSWICDYVEVISTGPGKECSHTHFKVGKTLSKKKYATEVNLCNSLDKAVKKVVNGTTILETDQGFVIAN